MEKTIQDIFDAQVIIYNMLDLHIAKSKGTTKITSISNSKKDLEKEIEKLRTGR